jgi:hypothetical protein
LLNGIRLLSRVLLTSGLDLPKLGLAGTVTLGISKGSPNEENKMHDRENPVKNFYC